MNSKYDIYEDDCAVLIAMSALLNAEVEGMKALNTERANNGMTIAYSEYLFSEASKPLKEYLKGLEKND